MSRTDKRARFEMLQKTEVELLNSRFSLIGGVDEAGRGPLAGPVVAAAAARTLFYPEVENAEWLLEIYDSKKVNEKNREMIFERLLADDSPFSIGIGIITAAEIDQTNILKATHKAMRTAADSLAPAPEFLLVDGTLIPEYNIEQEKVIKGDMKCHCIAAASIVAKVTRDRMMQEYDLLYPQYGFAKHKGYGTAAHYKALLEFGRCPIHRKTFKVKGLD